MKVFLTGGTGFIGSHLVDSFLSNSAYEVYTLIRDPRRLKWLEGKQVLPLIGDLENLPPLPSDIDLVFHLAGFTKALKSVDYYTVNQKGTASLFQALHQSGIHPKRVVVLSSMAAAGPCRQGRAVCESDLPCPVSPYGQSKLLGEQEALKYKQEYPLAVVRVGPVFGPRDRDFLPFFKFIQRGIIPSFGLKPSLISFCYVKDLVKALRLCAEKTYDSGEIFHIADPESCTWDQFGQKAAFVMGKKSLSIKFPLPIIYLAALSSDLTSGLRKKPSIINREKFNELKQEAWIADTGRTQKTLDFYPDYSLEQAIQETVLWYQRQEWL